MMISSGSNSNRGASIAVVLELIVRKEYEAISSVAEDNIKCRGHTITRLEGADEADYECLAPKGRISGVCENPRAPVDLLGLADMRQHRASWACNW